MESLIRQAWQRHGRIPPELKERIVIEHTSLISYIVSRIAVRLPSHVDLEDLHNTGVIGLMDAVDKYDPTKDCKFKTYAEFRIRGAILDHLRSLDWVPRSVRQKAALLEKVTHELEGRFGRPPTEEEISSELGLTIDAYQELLTKVGEMSLFSLEDLGFGSGEERFNVELELEIAVW